MAMTAGRRPVAKTAFITTGWFSLAALLLLSACTSPLVSRPSPPESLYLLEDGRPAAKALDPAGPSIQVSAPVAAPGYGGARLLYLREAHHLEAYAYHRWADAPARMLEPLLVRELEASGRFRVVVPSHVSSRSELRLDSELLYLHQRFTDGGSRVELGLRVDVVETDSARVLAGEVFRLQEPVTDPVPYGVVEASNRAVTALLRQVREWIISIFPDAE